MQKPNYQLNQKKVLVLGLGVSGRSAAQFLLERGATVVAVDRNSSEVIKLPAVQEMCIKGLYVTSDSVNVHVKQFDLMVVSPGVSTNHPLYVQAVEAGVEVVGEVELAFRELTHKCLAVTGTNGKTTVTLLVAHVLNQAGIKAAALGNVGTPLTSTLKVGQYAQEEVLVVELSSFQLETLRSRCIDAGVILNITPDHLDRYCSMEGYAKAKMKLHEVIKPSGELFVGERCAKEFGHLLSSLNPQYYCYGYSSGNFIYSDGKKIYVQGVESFSLPELYCKKNHDLENLMAAYALCRKMGVTSSQFLEALQTFHKPSHRLEFVKNVKGVHFYDDSKGTNIDAVVRAVETFDNPIILLAGGVDKGASYHPWVSSFSGKVSKICAIGQAANKIYKELNNEIPVEIFESLELAVKHAMNIACIGDVVLLSPGCSSYDMFRDYVHRGQEFQKIVHAL